VRIDQPRLSDERWSPTRRDQSESRQPWSKKSDCKFALPTAVKQPSSGCVRAYGACVTLAFALPRLGQGAKGKDPTFPEMSGWRSHRVHRCRKLPKRAGC
jgi:hypothetical protein